MFEVNVKNVTEERRGGGGGDQLGFGVLICNQVAVHCVQVPVLHIHYCSVLLQDWCQIYPNIILKTGQCSLTYFYMNSLIFS